jgi:hypothetical protein
MTTTSLLWRRFPRKGRPPAIRFYLDHYLDLDEKRRSFSTSPKKNNDDDDHQKETCPIMRSSYQQFSRNQYAAHTKCQDLLEACMDRLSKRMQMEDLYQDTVRTRQLADLGSADGSNTFQTLQVALQHLPKNVPLHMTLEEHPGSSRALLQQNLEHYLQTRHHSNSNSNHHLSFSILMKSFYESLFPPASMDFIMSYICLHWLDTSQVDQSRSLAEWKRLDGGGPRVDVDVDVDDPQPFGSQQPFVHVHEVAAPPSLQEAWRRRQLAHQHLSVFLQHRARELRPGAEMLLMMVGRPDSDSDSDSTEQASDMDTDTDMDMDIQSHFISPPGGGPCPLTVAMQRLVQEGALRPELLERTIIPYYLRTTQDVKEAYALALETDQGCWLELVDIRSYQSPMGGGTDTDTDTDTIEGVYELFWAIHGASVISAGPNEEELERIRVTLRQVFDELYDPQVGLTTTFVACVFRRRTRKRWRSTK